MKHANSYAEWKKYAEQYDSLKDIQIWRETQETGHYDWQYIKNLTSLLHEARINDDFKKVILLVRSNTVRNLANILNPALYSKSYIGTKHIVEDFQKEVF
jgi:TAG lipase/steryl ester hydrolase/phospholipase A2/LPA acyltransferase